ncbi:MAG TPA: hypothetical protein VNO30_41335 [Kofleriaceae bacterium]|nr:hypothetical protein [Kofleriaceae bacterium]
MAILLERRRSTGGGSIACVLAGGLQQPRCRAPPAAILAVSRRIRRGAPRR